MYPVRNDEAMHCDGSHENHPELGVVERIHIAKKLYQTIYLLAHIYFIYSIVCTCGLRLTLCKIRGSSEWNADVMALNNLVLLGKVL